MRSHRCGERGSRRPALEHSRPVKAPAQGGASSHCSDRLPCPGGRSDLHSLNEMLPLPKPTHSNQKGRLTCGIIPVALVSLHILGPVAVRGVEEVNVFVIVAGQELCQEQAHSSEGKG